MVGILSANGCMPVVGYCPIPDDTEFMYVRDYQEGENPDGTPIINVGFAKNGTRGVVDHAIIADLASTVFWENIIGKPALFPPIVHGPEHLQNGSDPIPDATIALNGLLPAPNGRARSYFGADLKYHPLPAPIYLRSEEVVSLDPGWTAGQVAVQSTIRHPQRGVYAVFMPYLYAANRSWPPSADVHFEVYDMDEAEWVTVTETCDLGDLDGITATTSTFLRPILLSGALLRIFRAPANGLAWRLVIDQPGGAAGYCRAGLIFQKTMATPLPFSPQPPAHPPTLVTNTPNLALASDFHLPDFTDRLNDYGPLVGQYKWAVNRPDDFGMGFALRPAIDTHTYNTNEAEWLELKLRYWGPMDGWGTGGINSAAYAQGGAESGQSTGFLASSPSYWEAGLWLPQLAATDPANMPGLWPFIALRTDPAQGGTSVEYILCAFHSADYTQLECGWHLWDIDGTQIAAGDNNPVPGMLPDMSGEWHVYGIWINTTRVRWYLDGAQIYSAPTPQNGLAPLYVQIANGYTNDMHFDQANEYTMKISYLNCWTA